MPLSRIILLRFVVVRTLVAIRLVLPRPGRPARVRIPELLGESVLARTATGLAAGVSAGLFLLAVHPLLLSFIFLAAQVLPSTGPVFAIIFTTSVLSHHFLSSELLPGHPLSVGVF